MPTSKVRSNKFRGASEASLVYRVREAAIANTPQSLMKLAAFEPVQDGRIHIEKINLKGTPSNTRPA